MDRDLPDVYIKGGASLPNWRDVPEDSDLLKDDDEDRPASADVIEILGFDPDELGEDDEEA